jgi:hypothetical protein
MLPNQSPESVEKLLNPADPQDVPHAIELICAVGNLHSLNKSGFSPSQMKTIEALQLIGTLFHVMIESFVNSNLSLTAPLEHLAQYAHLAFITSPLCHRDSFFSPMILGPNVCSDFLTVQLFGLGA